MKSNYYYIPKHPINDIWQINDDITIKWHEKTILEGNFSPFLLFYF
jgi:hypothetical protein